MSRQTFLLKVFFVVTLVWSASLHASNWLVGLNVTQLRNDTIAIHLNFKLKSKLEYKHFFLKNSDRLVLDFNNTRARLAPQTMHQNFSQGPLSELRVASAQQRLRLVLTLKSGVHFRLSQEGSVLTIILKKGITSRLNMPDRAPLPQHIATLKKIDFRGAGHEKGMIILSFDRENVETNVITKPHGIIIQAKQVKLASAQVKRLDVQDFNTPVSFIEAYPVKDALQISIDTTKPYEQLAYQVGKRFMLEVAPKAIAKKTQKTTKNKIYTGKRLSLNFQNIKVRSVLQLLADFSGKNLVVSDSVQGEITIRLNDVPWTQALALIMKTRGLGSRTMADVLLIAPQVEIAAQEKQELLLHEQSKQLAPLLSTLIQINYAKAQEIANLLSVKGNTLLSSRGSISTDVRTNTLWVQDTAVQLKKIQSIIQKLDVPVKQVVIEARVVIVNKDSEKDIGVRFGLSRPNSLSGTLSGASQTASGTAIQDVSPTDRLNVDLAAPVTAGAAGSIGIALARLADGILLDLELSALESEGQAEIISSPRLITANQQAATIEAGEEIPYQESTSSGATSIAFKKAVLSLKVTPQITPDNKIILDLAVNQDTPSPERFNGVPAILTKQIETNVLVNNGQTVVIGGIYTQDKKEAVKRVPFFGRIPFLGALFRNRQNIVNHEELLIFITPKILKHSFMTR